MLSSEPPTVSIWSEPSGPNQEIMVYGEVTAGVANGATVTISGVARGTATADSYGNFSYTANASGEGSISATATDVWGQTSSTTTAMVLGSVPSIDNLVASPVYDQNDNFVDWELTGTISDFAGTFTLDVSGAISGSTPSQRLQPGRHVHDFPTPSGKRQRLCLGRRNELLGRVVRMRSIAWLMGM